MIKCDIAIYGTKVSANVRIENLMYNRDKKRYTFMISAKSEGETIKIPDEIMTMEYVKGLDPVESAYELIKKRPYFTPCINE